LNLSWSRLTERPRYFVIITGILTRHLFPCSAIGGDDRKSPPGFPLCYLCTFLPSLVGHPTLTWTSFVIPLTPLFTQCSSNMTFLCRSFLLNFRNPIMNPTVTSRRPHPLACFFPTSLGKYIEWNRAVFPRPRANESFATVCTREHTYQIAVIPHFSDPFASARCCHRCGGAVPPSSPQSSNKM